MKGFEKFLFFYSIIATTTLLISLGVFEPKPINLISITLLLPIVFYFWIRLTSPERTSPEIWSLRFLLVLVTLCGLATYAYYLKTNQTEPKEKIIIITATAKPVPPSPTLKPKSDETIIDILYGTPTPTPTP